MAAVRSIIVTLCPLLLQLYVLLNCWERGIHEFSSMEWHMSCLQWNGTGHLKHTSGQAMHSRVVDQHKIDSMIFYRIFVITWCFLSLFGFLLAFFERGRQRTWDWEGREVGGSGRTWGRRRNMMKIQCIKILRNKNIERVSLECCAVIVKRNCKFICT